MPLRRDPFRPSSLSLNAVRPLPVFAGRGVLTRALSRALGSERAAEAFLIDTLEDAGMDAVPEGRDNFQQFVREEILPRLMPVVRLDQLHDLVRRTIGEEGSMHPPPLKPHGSAPGTLGSKPPRRARVILVEPDAFRRVAASRELVREFDVEVVPRASDVLRLEAFHAVVMALDAEGETVARELAARKTRAGLVVMDDPAHREAMRRVVDRWPNERVAVVPRDAPGATVSARVRIVTS